nr:hypothetical protein [Tanacetum cinerariifolium]
MFHELVLMLFPFPGKKGGKPTINVVEDISPTKEPQVLHAFPTDPTLQLNMKFQPSSESLFTYVVWIFFPFLVHSVAPHYLLSLMNGDIIFDPGICYSTFSRPDICHRCGTVRKFNTHRSHLNKCPMMIHGQNNPPLDVLLDNLASWCDLVWFHACIPRHTFNMWLILKQRLRTQDCLRIWEIDTDLVVVCPLCETQPDSHEHLFFDCPFSQQVWSRVQQIAGLKGAGPSLASIITHLMPIVKKKSSKSCIGKLVVAAAAYFVWHERNSRLFNKVKRSVTGVVECILSNVQLKLLFCRFNKSRDAILFARL